MRLCQNFVGVVSVEIYKATKTAEAHMHHVAFSLGLVSCQAMGTTYNTGIHSLGHLWQPVMLAHYGCRPHWFLARGKSRVEG